MASRLGRLVSEVGAAEAIGIELATFRQLVATRRLPGPIPEVGLYDIKAIDLALDKISGIGSPSNEYDRWRAGRAT